MCVCVWVCVCTCEFQIVDFFLLSVDGFLHHLGLFVLSTFVVVHSGVHSVLLHYLLSFTLEETYLMDFEIWELFSEDKLF